MVGVVAKVQWTRRIVVQQKVVTKLRDLRASRSLHVRRVAVEHDDPAEAGKDGLVGKLVLILEFTGVALLIVESLEAVRSEMVHIEFEIRFLIRSKAAGIIAAVNQQCIERAVGNA